MSTVLPEQCRVSVLAQLPVGIYGYVEPCSMIVDKRFHCWLPSNAEYRTYQTDYHFLQVYKNAEGEFSVTLLSHWYRWAPVEQNLIFYSGFSPVTEFTINQRLLDQHT